MNILFFIIKQFYSIVKISNCFAALTSTLEGCKSFLSKTSEKVSNAKSCVFASSLKCAKTIFFVFILINEVRFKLESSLFKCPLSLKNSLLQKHRTLCLHQTIDIMITFKNIMIGIGNIWLDLIRHIPCIRYIY